MKDQGFLYQIGLAPDDAATHGHGPSSWEVSRREFFKIGAAASGGLLLSMYWPSPATAQVGAGVFEPNVFVRIGTDGLVTFTSPECEMGQGSRTSLAVIVTDELDADWSMVRIEQAPLDEKYGAQWTGGSTSIRTRWTELRQAGATARALLVAAAAQTWGVDPASCTTDRGVVIHPASGRKLPYGDVAEAAARLPAPSDVPLKDPKDFRLIGKPMGSVDIPAMTRGEAVYGMDLTLPGMRYAVIERCPVFGGTVARFDASRAEAVPGVLAVVEVEGTGRPHHVAAGVAVVAETTWAALSGRDALVVDWDEGQHASDNSAALSEQMHALTKEPCEVVFDQGDAETILADDADTIQAVYAMPFLSHAPMEPMNCTAHVQGHRCELWAPTQNPAANRGAVAKVLGLAPENVHVNIIMTGGAFGRRLQSDYAIEAALLSKAVGAPVKVVWTREDDMQHDFYRPVNLHRLAATLDENG
ncbi:MAG: xanthine dehydrogenase family protein molybdopterin-binding subunit, partial [Planctomycetota bacterium]